MITSYTRADQLISQERNGQKSYYLYDGFDSVRMLANDECEITDTYVYDAFGNLISSAGNTVNNFLYRGEQFDSFTGLYYLRARYMNPSTGTFITMDEYAGSIFEPVSLHKYLYANANPLMYSDPSGYSSLGEMIATTAIIGVLNGISTAVISIATFLGEGGQWGDIDWGSVLLNSLGSACVGAIFGVAGWYAQFIQSAAIMCALGSSSLIFATLSAIKGYSYGQMGNSELSALYWLLSILGFSGAYRAFSNSHTLQYTKTSSGSNSDTYSPAKQGPLPKEKAETFSGGSYTQKTLTQDTVFYRVYGGDAGKVGSYMSRTPQNGGLQSQLDLALNPEWGNTAQYVTRVLVPKGTVIYEGTAAPQIINDGTGYLPGGGNQVYIPEVNPSWFVN